jgi:exonuclease SbcC
MIICSIRLKNIKSYGEGASGDGITVEFAPGINRIAGRNGHGKSTLIESLGYALFLTPPLFEETVQVSTYLLRAGQRSGEIDVTFEHHGEVYRIERGLGIRNTRRSKVVQISDGSIAAEGDHEVSRFLCRLLDCPGPERLSELFAKLVGVKQGRLAWPFDSKPTEARKHFEPLLDVEIFRQCFDRLKPVVDEFTEAAQVEATRLATITERVRDRQGAPERV